MPVRRHRRTLLQRLRATLPALVVRTLVLRRGRRVDNRIVFASHAAIGNMYSFRRYLEREHPEIEIACLAWTRAEYRSARARGDSTTLDATRLRHLARVARSRAVITGAGPGSLRTWVRARYRPIFIDAWHGVGFKSRISTAAPEFAAYDAHFVSSDHVAAYYRTHGGVPVVTGYARMDDLLADEGAAAPRARAEFPEAGPTARFVLVAPTWDIVRSDRLDDRVILEALSRAAVQHDLVIAYRPHKYASPVMIDDLPRVRLLGSDRFPNAEQLLVITDVLVTDWSSIGTDYLALDRPIVYLDTAPPVAALGPLDETDRPGELVSTAEQLAAAVVTAALTPHEYLAEHGAGMNRTRARAWGASLDGRSSARYLEAIVALDSARSHR